MAYQRLRTAFLFQAVVSLVSLASVLAMGKTGLVLIGLLFFRPFVLKRKPGAPEDPIRRLYGRVFRISAVAAAVFVVLLYAGREAGVLGEADNLLLLLIILPSAMLIHGVTGFILSGEE